MSLDPAAPQHLHDRVEAFAQTAQAVVDLARACSVDDLAQPTDCPGWTVHDQISHVVGVEAWLEGHKDPRVEMPPYEHIRNDLGKKVEYAVEVRRGRTGAQVVAELEDVLAQRLSMLRSPELTDTSIIAGPFGPDQAVTVMLLRTFDVWTHEQDIRSALGRPGNLDSPAAAVFLSSVMVQLPKLIARGAGVEPGHAVVIDITGPGSALAARQCVRVEVDEQGRTRGHEISGDPRPDGPVTTISLSTEAFTRRAAGRRPVSDTEYSVVGDDAIARRVLEALVVTH
ncbi:MAG: maleylpyruvate isomerase family mycothiol-dependent enzyme [Actinobacteria bacterium]|nr:maleylpyruvate isomerase family mycothiol-dependent enzyme [Actinomycetota bacterium]